jgi:branched-chain amino acid aminotransferase
MESPFISARIIAPACRLARDVCYGFSVPARVYIDGRITDENGGLVPVLDRGFLYGDSVYEVTRTAGGRPVDLGRHLDRLARSAAAIGMDLPARAVLAGAVGETLAAAGTGEAYVRIIVTRGGGEIGLDPALADRPRLVVIVRPLVLLDPAVHETGVEVALVAVRRNPRRALDPAIKSGNYLNNILGLREARARGAHECVMLNADGWLTEGSTSNLFIVRGDAVRTPAFEDGLLDGITRGRVLELAGAAGIPAGEAHLGRDDLLTADEAFLTSSLRGVLPVVRVDGLPLGAGRPGPVTRTLAAYYGSFLERVAAGIEGA